MPAEKHPRFSHFPWHSDYVNMASWYRPFQMFLNEADYVSKSVNTDRHGLRLQLNDKGEVLSLEECREGTFDIMVGGSSVFGVDASSDRTTLPALLSTPATRCLNWGVRAAGTQQELLAFLFFKRYVKNIRRVVIFSGVNLCSIASMEDIMIYPDQGALFSEEYFMKQSLEGLRAREGGDTALDPVLDSLKRRIKRAYEKRSGLRALMRLFVPKLRKHTSAAKPPERNVSGFEKRVEALLDLLGNELATWAGLAKGLDFELVYVLQPALRWSRKAANEVEEECLAADAKRYAGMALFANPAFHQRYASRLSSMCDSLGIPFVDSNAMLDNVDGSAPVFTDVCHLTDHGNELLAKKLGKALDSLS